MLEGIRREVRTGEDGGEDRATRLRVRVRATVPARGGRFGGRLRLQNRGVDAEGLRSETQGFAMEDGVCDLLNHDLHFGDGAGALRGTRAARTLYDAADAVLEDWQRPIQAAGQPP